MELDFQSMLFEFIGGLGIFLLGIKYMGDGLQKIAGERLQYFLDKMTSNPFMGVLAGIIVTILLQTSSGTTVLTVGLVNAGFMTLRQAIGVIMGANIGTTMTAFIIGFDIQEYGLPILAIGALMLFFFKKEKLMNVGITIFGFGSLFFGLKLMGTGLKPLSTLDAFHDLTISMSNHPILGVLVGTVLTMIVQSSSATIGILQGLMMEGAIQLQAALPVLFGDNIGTTITAVIASIGTSIAARRAALTHVVFNLIGAVIILTFLGAYTNLIEYIQGLLGLNPAMTIAFSHGIYNLLNTIIQFPFIGFLAFLVTKLIPGEDVVVKYKPQHLDPIFLKQSPSIALDQAKLEVIRMGEYAIKGMTETSMYMNTNNQKHSEMAMQIEGALNNLDHEITDYLVELSGSNFTEVERHSHSALINAVRDIERIGDHYENIIELVNYKQSNKVDITEQGMIDLNEMFDLTISTVKEAIRAIENNDREAALSVIQKENAIDKMERNLRKKHIIRLNEGACTGTAGIVFADIISNLERMGDHAVNLADEVLEKK